MKQKNKSQESKATSGAQSGDPAIPDNVALHPNSLPYGSNLSAPVIKPDNLSGWKHSAAHCANKNFQERFDKIKAEYEELANEIKWNDIIFNAEVRFKPCIGKVYFLYHKKDKYFMSLFAPNECTYSECFVGAFRLHYDNRWIPIDKNNANIPT